MEFWDLLQKHSRGELSYQEGLALFLQIKPKSSLKSFFNVEDRASRRKLKSLLDEKYLELKQNRQENNFMSFGTSKHRNTPINLEILPAELRTEYGKQSARIREISSLHARLYNCSTDEQRYHLASQIIGLSEQRRATFQRVDRFLETGQDIKALRADRPEPVRPDLEKDYKVEHELKLLRSQRSKLKGNPRRVEEYNKIVERIKELEAKRYV